MKRLAFAILVLITIINSITFAANGTIPGTGSESDPYLIEDFEDFQAFCDLSTATKYWSAGVYTQLTTDLDLAGTKYTNALIAPDTDNVRSGFQGTSFDGVFDGNNNIISNFNINISYNYQAIFGSITGTVNNLVIDNFNISGIMDSWLRAGLCGINSGIITNSNCTGTVSGDRYVGGLCGINNGIIKDCHTNIKVTGNDNLGGLCGMNNGTIENCSTNGSILGQRSVGGLCGGQYGGEINKCSSNCTINRSVGNQSSVGGLCGKNTSGSISNSFATGSVYGYSLTGGLCGNNNGLLTNCYYLGTVIGDTIGGLCEYNSGNILYCYANGSFSGDIVGGLCSGNAGIISNCYSTGNVISDNEIYGIAGGICSNNIGFIENCYTTCRISGKLELGGICGYKCDPTKIKNCYYYLYGCPNNNIGYALNTDQFADSNNFIGFDFVNNDNDGTDEIWQFTTGYCPKLFWQDNDGPTVPDYPIMDTSLTGSGTIDDPFVISNHDDFMEFCANNNLRYGYYILTCDIDLSSSDYSNYSDAIIPDGFYGHFNGNNHILSNFEIYSSEDYIGLFGKIYGSVKNLSLQNIKITCPRGAKYVGGICGKNFYGKISNCYVSGKISCKDYLIGGICGNNSGEILECMASCILSGNSYLGGICAENSGTIRNSYATGKISAEYYLGGLCGNNTGIINNSYATGEIYGSISIGGFCGINEGTISSCYSTGNIFGRGDRQYRIGGLCGYNSGDILTSYTVSLISAYLDIDGHDTDALCGENDSGTITNCYCYYFNRYLSEYGKELDDIELQNKDSFVGFNFVENQTDETEDGWIIDAGFMPRLYWQTSPGFNSPIDNISTNLSGSGTIVDPFLIYNINDLLEFRNNSQLNIGYFSLQNNIDLYGKMFDSSFIQRVFFGNFQGNGFLISHLTIDGGSGFFSQLYGDIENLGLEYVNIKGESTIGSIAGSIYKSKINNCFSSGIIQGESTMGGFIGNVKEGSISNCYSTCSIYPPSSYKNIGGFIGKIYSNSTITNCYSAGKIYTIYGRGFIGSDNSNNSIITNCFWDIEISDRETSYGGIGKTTEEMQNISIYLNAGWDFVDENENGTEDIWQMPVESPGYPIFKGIKNIILNGDGSKNNPYLINNLDEFNEFCEVTLSEKYWAENTYIRLNTDLDLAPNLPGRKIFTQAPIGPIYNKIFKGHFDGNGHTIHNLTIEGNDYCGLFGYTGPKSSISNLGLSNTHINCNDYSGGIVGTNNGKINSCYSNCYINGDSQIGGIAGSNYKDISNCYVTGSINSLTSTGGIVGESTLFGDSSSGHIISCYTTASLNSKYVLGTLPIAGAYYNTEIVNCYYYKYCCPPYAMNGITSLSDSWLTSKSSFIGFDFAGSSSDGTEDIWSIQPGYMPRLSWQNAPGLEPPYYWDSISTSLEGCGELHDPFIIANYNDLMEFRNNSKLRYGHYRLTNNIDLINDTYDDAFIPEAFMGYFDGNNHKILNMHISNNTDYNMLGFFAKNYGTINNLGIENLVIIASPSSGAGLASYNAGEINNCYTTGELSSDSYPGGLIGINSGTINNCYSNCSVSRSTQCYSLGGLVAENELEAEITQSYSTGVVNGSGVVGGLVGENSGDILNCYSTSPVHGTSYVGGLVGRINYGNINYCYSIGKVTGDGDTGGFIGKFNNGEAKYCYWDIETSETNIAYLTSSGKISYGTSRVIEGRSTEQMQDVYNNYAFWPMIYIYGLFPEGIWRMPYQQPEYPVLAWQRDIPGDLTGLYGVDIEDFSLMSQSWLSEYQLTDLQSLAQHWLEGK